ncbi:LysR substrate-binding domain-containing protein [Rhizobium sp. SSA_523]|uniref:LysR substrate-binding domain-containing protein n=1 Tax=Rhizobium sp. SSA_523 TaxID=2952477 RepID=UPI0020907B0E|nr:LysR substrate-binding domain-containing protein [Rhizobium sp. SSA_523]MCO5730531.1 LysR substrate-binding domain-containing protein [Rhizobium sp. SSA_523]WKC25570.1 LysR substrate-binding domain-containing protein [Rhizobium sp. SSA_523]
MKLSRQLPLNALRVFEAAARLGSFTKAADELHMTQTAVSYQVKLLEEHVGALLFLRQARRAVLSPTGERMLLKVSEALGLMADAVADARQQTGGILEIRSTPTFASHWLARHIGTFQLQHPGLAVRILRIDKPADFRSDNADLSVGPEKRPAADLEAHRLFHLEFTPMLSPKLAATIGGVTSPADLLRLPLIDGSKEWWHLWLEAAGVAEAPVQAATFDTDGALDLGGSAAIAGHGVALLSRFFHQDDLDSGRLIMPFDIFLKDSFAYWLTYPKSRRKSAKVQAFRQWLMETLPADLRDQPAEELGPKSGSGA